MAGLWKSTEHNKPEKTTAHSTQNRVDSLRNASSWPTDFTITNFASADLTPSPACLAVAPTGAVYVGVDMIGSLGKKPGNGRIVRLVDSNNDGKVDAHTNFAVVDNPRGILPVGDQLFCAAHRFLEGNESGNGHGPGGVRR